MHPKDLVTQTFRQRFCKEPAFVAQHPVRKPGGKPTKSTTPWFYLDRFNIDKVKYTST